MAIYEKLDTNTSITIEIENATNEPFKRVSVLMHCGEFPENVYPPEVIQPGTSELFQIQSSGMLGREIVAQIDYGSELLGNIGFYVSCFGFLTRNEVKVIGPSGEHLKVEIYKKTTYGLIPVAKEVFVNFKIVDIRKSMAA